MSELYRLNGRIPVPCKDSEEWATWYGNHNRTVAKDEFGDAVISTVFLSIGHGFSSNDMPVLFETMVFGGELDEEQDRYCTWEEAEAGHMAMVARVKQGLQA